MKNNLETWHQHTLQLARTIAGIYETVGSKNDTVEALLDVYCVLRRNLCEFNGGVPYKASEAYLAMKTLDLTFWKEKPDMGLDMNLYACEAGEDIPNLDTLYNESSTLQSWYWRKANAIHQWFVTNVQNEEDDCGVYEVSHDQLKRLTVDVNWVLMFPEEAETYLPTQDGFFFGSQDYDALYMHDIELTRQYLREALRLKEKNPDTRFFYCASW